MARLELGTVDPIAGAVRAGEDEQRGFAGMPTMPKQKPSYSIKLWAKLDHSTCTRQRPSL